jgi:hypothetical protein
LTSKEQSKKELNINIGSVEFRADITFDDAGKIVDLLYHGQSAAIKEFFRRYADGIEKGDLVAILVKTPAITGNEKVPLKGSASLTKKAFLDMSEELASALSKLSSSRPQGQQAAGKDKPEPKPEASGPKPKSSEFVVSINVQNPEAAFALGMDKEALEQVLKAIARDKDDKPTEATVMAYGLLAKQTAKHAVIHGKIGGSDFSACAVAVPTAGAKEPKWETIFSTGDSGLAKRMGLNEATVGKAIDKARELAKRPGAALTIYKFSFLLANPDALTLHCRIEGKTYVVSLD